MRRSWPTARPRSRRSGVTTAAIVAHGEAAIEAVGRHDCTPAVESVIEATVLLSGLGFESGGLSLSHGLLRGLSALPELAGALHGEQVAFGTIVQLVLEGRPDAELRAHVDLLARLGLPTTLAALGWTRVSGEQIAQVATLTLGAPYIGNFQSALDADAIAAAIVRADALGAASAGLQR